ncbi:MAG: hypothetical protein U0414_27510 [Polyangiaceae bacterium]
MTLPRSHIKTSACALVASLALASLMAGCPSESTDSCADHSAPCSGGAGGATSSTTAASMTNSSSATMTSSSTGVSMDCAVSLTSGPTKGDSCGVFVDPVGGDNMQAGTMAAPLKTLSAAVIAWTAGKTIYVCEGALTDTSGIVLPAGVVVYGGLDCSAGYKIKAADARTTLEPDAGEIGLRLADGQGTTEVDRLKVLATAGAAPGSSAIGVIVGEVPSVFADVDVETGDAAAGQDSTTPTDNIGPTNSMAAPIAGGVGADANTTTPTMTNPGGLPGTNPFCTTTGGAGGEGGKVVAVASDGIKGDDGTATPTPPIVAGNDGVGGPGDMGGGCAPGHQGSNGASVMPGPNATLPGTISSMGYAGASGGVGEDGRPGLGGGGGGAKGLKDVTPPLADIRGASRGGGGAGGCGGHGAPGGGAGGASIGMIVLGAAPTLSGVSFTVGKGGAGGSGAAGQFGAVGGKGGNAGSGAGTPTACDGGKGGQGSNGGAGGGGHGGHSLAIAYVTSAPAAGFTSTRAGGGLGGASDAGGKGDDGSGAETLKLPAQ